VTAARQDDVHVDLNLSYAASASLDMRRVPNMFASSSSNVTCNMFDNMPDAHKVFGEMSSTHRMFTDEEGADIMNDMIEGGHAPVAAEVDTGKGTKMAPRTVWGVWGEG
jgi:hypothetical protein